MFVAGSGPIAAKLCGLKALPLNTRVTQQSRRGQSIEKTGGFALAPQTMCSPRRGCRTGVPSGESAFVPGPTAGELLSFAKRRSDRDWALLGRASALQAKGANNESPAIISNSYRTGGDNGRCKHSYAPSSQTSRSRAECGAAASRPSRRRSYEDFKGHEREIGTAKA